MASYDKGMEQRVWQRVRGEQQSQPETHAPAADLPGMIQAEQIAAASYWAMSRRVGPKEAAVLQKISREEQAHAACLRGMYIQITGQKPTVQAPGPTREPLELALRKSYAGELRSIAAYQSRATDPEYGHVFASLAKQEREHSRAVLELLGSLGK